MGLYDDFLTRKSNGESLSLEELQLEELKRLFISESKTDAMIADIFDVTPSKITNIRRKHGITIQNSIIEEFLDSRSALTKGLNSKMKENTLTDENISKIAKSLTHFVFRNGPIEDMHADINKNITQEDMKQLNKFMVNRMAYVFTLIKEEQWAEFNFLIETMAMFGGDWDDATPEDDGNREMFIQSINKFRS